MRAICACAAATVPAGCGGLQAPRSIPAVQTPYAQVPGLPEPAAVNGTLIYAAGDESSFVFTFPHGKLVHKIAATGLSACSDRQGNVFVTQVESVAKYQHGAAKPMESYKFAGSVYSCSVNPKTHELAVVLFCRRGCSQELIIVRDHGLHKRRYQVSPLSSLLYCAYDDKGNLFVDGYNGTTFGLAELPHGAHRFIGISVDKQIKYPAQIQWDGQYLAIERRIYPLIYRVSVSGTQAHVVGRIRFNGIGYRATQSWIENTTIAIPSAEYNKRPMEIFLYNYPAGGEPIKIIKGFIRGGSHAMVDGVTFSVAR